MGELRVGVTEGLRVRFSHCALHEDYGEGVSDNYLDIYLSDQKLERLGDLLSDKVGLSAQNSDIYNVII